MIQFVIGLGVAIFSIIFKASRDRIINRRAITYGDYHSSPPRRPAVREISPFIGPERTAYSSVGEQCPICHIEMDIANMVLLKCSHGLHVDCYNIHMQYCKKCPVCLREMNVRIASSPY